MTKGRHGGLQTLDDIDRPARHCDKADCGDRDPRGYAKALLCYAPAEQTRRLDAKKVLTFAVWFSRGRPRHEDQRSSQVAPTGTGDEGSTETPSGSCPSGAACGARITKGRCRCNGGAVVTLRPAATKAKRSVAAAIK